jgi:hypothetical protein
MQSTCRGELLAREEHATVRGLIPVSCLFARRINHRHPEPELAHDLIAPAAVPVGEPRLGGQSDRGDAEPGCRETGDGERIGGLLDGEQGGEGEETVGRPAADRPNIPLSTP